MGRIVPLQMETREAERNASQIGDSSYRYTEAGPQHSSSAQAAPRSAAGFSTSRTTEKETMLEDYAASHEGSKRIIRPASTRISRIDALFDEPRAELLEAYDHQQPNPASPEPKKVPRASLGKSVRRATESKLHAASDFSNTKSARKLEPERKDSTAQQHFDRPDGRGMSEARTKEGNAIPISDPLSSSRSDKTIRPKTGLQRKYGFRKTSSPEQPSDERPRRLELAQRKATIRARNPRYSIDEPRADLDLNQHESESDEEKAQVNEQKGVDISLSGNSTHRSKDSPLPDTMQATLTQQSLTEDRDPENEPERDVMRTNPTVEEKNDPSSRRLNMNTGNETNLDKNMGEIQIAQAALNSVMDMLLPSSPSTNDAFSMPSVATTNVDTDDMRSGSSSSSQLTQDRIALAEAALQNFMDVLQDLERPVENESNEECRDAYHNEDDPPVKAKIHLFDLFRWSLSSNVDAEEKLHYLEKERQRMSIENQDELRELIKTDEAMKRQRLQQSREAENQRHRIHEIEEDFCLLPDENCSFLRPAGEDGQEHQRKAAEYRMQQLAMLSPTGESAELFLDETDQSIENIGLTEQSQKGTDSMNEGAPAWAVFGGRPVVSRDEHLIDLNSLSHRHNQAPTGQPPAWISMGGRPVVSMDGPVTRDTIDKEAGRPLGVQSRRNPSELSSHLLDEAPLDDRPRRPPSLSSSSYSQVSTNPSWRKAQRPSGSSKDQSETSAIMATATSAASALLLNREQLTSSRPPSGSSPSMTETPTSSITQTTGSSFPSWAAFGGRPIIMSTSESSQVAERDSPESILLPSSFHEDDDIAFDSDASEGTFEASLPLFENHRRLEALHAHPSDAIPDLVSIHSSSIPDDDTSTEPEKLKSTVFFGVRTAREKRDRSDERPLLSQTDVISVGSAGDVHRHVGLTIRYLEDRSRASQSSALSIDPDLKTDERAFDGGAKIAPAMNARWTDTGKRRSLGGYVRSGLKGIRNTVSGRHRGKFRQRSKSVEARKSLLHENESDFDHTLVIDRPARQN